VGICENASVFFSSPVKDYKSPTDWDGTETAYRLRVHGNSGREQMIAYLDSVVQHHDAPQLEALVIGKWDSESGFSSAEIIQALAARRDRLSGLLAIFLGDITHEESEISRIQSSDVSPLLNAFGHLEVLRVRGGTGLQLSKARHESLRALIVETGGLPRSVIREICCCDFPNLVHLELWLGASMHGWDGRIEDLHPILDGQRFSRLRYLGLRHSEIADEIALALVNAPVLKQLRVLDLSSIRLSDAGGHALLRLPSNIPLGRLILRGHSLSDAIARKLDRQILCKVITDDLQGPDEPGHPILAT
jgi:hypothetical protein